MGQPSFPNNLQYRVERIEADLAELHRKRPRRNPNLRDMQDVNGWGAADGHALVYDTEFGRYKPVIQPPMVTFNMNGALTVSRFDDWVVPAACKLFLVKARITTTGSSTSTAVLKKGASTTIATYSFTSGNHAPTTYPALSTTLAEDDVLWVDVTAAGTSAAGLTLSVWAMAA